MSSAYWRFTCCSLFNTTHHYFYQTGFLSVIQSCQIYKHNVSNKHWIIQFNKKVSKFSEDNLRWLSIRWLKFITLIYFNCNFVMIWNFSLIDNFSTLFVNNTNEIIYSINKPKTHVLLLSVVHLTINQSYNPSLSSYHWYPINCPLNKLHVHVTVKINIEFK